MEIEDLETKHDNSEFVAGDLAEDFKQVVKVIKNLKKALNLLENRVEALENAN